MEYIKDITIMDAVMHVLDSNGEEPILNDFYLELNEDTYTFLFKHIEKCLNNDELKYALFNEEANNVKDISQEYFFSYYNNLLETSKELAIQLFSQMKTNINIPSCDLLIVGISTEYGPMLCILKMDYVKNFTHRIEFVESRKNINLVPHTAGLPSSSQRIEKAAFIKPIRKGQEYNLMVLDKQKRHKDEEYGANYFINNYLGCTLVDNERDLTRSFVNAAEIFTRNNIKEDADKAETIRTKIKKELREKENIDIEKLSENLFREEPSKKEEFEEFISSRGIEKGFRVDKQWIDKKLKRIRLKIDKDIDLYINEDAYQDKSKFEIQRVGDGSINIIIKHVMNYIEK